MKKYPINETKSDEDFINYIKMLDDETQQKKRKNKKTIVEMGDVLADEMAERGKKEEYKRNVIINEINQFKHNYNDGDLINFDLRELYGILKHLEYQNRGFFRKALDLLTKK